MMNSTAWAGVVAAVLCVCMFICLADGVGSGAVDGEKSVWKTMMTREPNGTCGEGVTWVWSGNTLTIKGTGEMTNYEYYNFTPWFSYKSEITTIVIENGVTSIGPWAFYDTGVENVTIPGSIKTIGKYAFSSCDNLESVFIPDSVTSIENYTFDNSGLKSVTIPDSVKTIGYGAFYSCRHLESIFIPDSVTSIGSFSFYKSGLKNVTIPGSVKTIGSSAFSHCDSLESVFIPDSVTSIGDYAFSASSVKNVTIPDSVKTIGDYMFYSCASLESVFIPDSVTSIGNYAFSYSGVRNMTIPDSVKTIGDHAFYSCTSLESVFIPDSVTSVGNYSFSHCSQLSTVFYQGTLDLLNEGVHDVFDRDFAKIMCVSQEYNVTTFCGVEVTSDKDICQEFQSMFSYCSKPVYIDGDLIVEDRYKTSNRCVMVQCNEEPQAVSAWSLCNRTSDEERICLEEECINNEETIDKKVSIRIKLEEAIEVKELVREQNINITDELQRIMKECGIEEMMIGWHTDEEGEINEFVIFTDDKGVYNNRTTMRRIQEQCMYLLPRVTEVEISRKDICLKEECKKDIYVEIELAYSIEVDYLDVDVILEILKEEIGIDTSGILIGWDTDESGRIIRVIIYVDDEATANLISSRITDVWPIVRRARVVVVNADNLSRASMKFVGGMSEIVLILFVLCVADVIAWM